MSMKKNFEMAITGLTVCAAGCAIVGTAMSVDEQKKELEHLRSQLDATDRSFVEFKKNQLRRDETIFRQLEELKKD